MEKNELEDLRDRVPCAALLEQAGFAATELEALRSEGRDLGRYRVRAPAAGKVAHLEYRSGHAGIGEHQSSALRTGIVTDRDARISHVDTVGAAISHHMTLGTEHRRDQPRRGGLAV